MTAVRKSLALALLTLGVMAWGRPAAAGRPVPSAPTEGASFAADAQLLMRVAACSGDTPVPAEWTAIVVAHCKEHDKRTAAFRTKYVDKALPFFQALRPPGLPTTVVYPFGGG